MEPQGVPVFRPPYLADGPEFQGSLVESPANIFYQKVKASRATMNRMQFQWRSVSDNLLLSPVAYLRFQLEITSPSLWTQVLAYANVSGVKFGVQVGAAVTLAGMYTAGQRNNTADSGSTVPGITFADGDAFLSCCSSANLVYNGTSISLNRCNRWWRDFVRTQISSDDAAQVYKSAGGAYDARDTRGVLTLTGANGVSTHCAGLTDDSGISDRTKALYALLRGVEGADAELGKRIVQVSYPIPLAPFNPWKGCKIAASCPYAKCPLAIPHLSSGSLDFLLEDFKQGFIRRLGNTLGGGALNRSRNECASDLGVKLVEGANSEPYIELQYFRLSHTRALRESYRFNIWQAQTFMGPVPPTGVTNGHAAVANLGDNLTIHCSATAKDDAASTQAVGISALLYAAGAYTIQFDVINLAQVPSYLLISVPKLGSTYTHSNGAAECVNAVRNLSTNLSIRSMKIIVNSARGAIDKSEDSTIGFIDAERLYDMTRENANKAYFKEGGFRAWRDYGCAVLLSSSQFAPGIQACDGVAYPVQIQIEMDLENRAVDVTAGGNSAIRTSASLQVVADKIRAQAQATAIFTKIILSATATSATTNAMNYPLDAAERLMNVAGQR